jgi:hypothetical protein
MSAVQGLPSSGQPTPLPLFTMVQPPSPSHVELCWQFDGVHTYVVPLHAPAVHTSLIVQALPSLHAEPSGLAGLEQVPFAGLHAPTVWHWSRALQTTGVVPVHAPAWQPSVCVQALPSSHAVPSALALALPRQTRRSGLLLCGVFCDCVQLVVVGFAS